MALNNHVENFTLDMAPGGIAPVLNVSQGDTGRAYTADMYWGGASYDVSGLTVRLRGRKRDNTVFDYALPAPSGTKVAFDLEDKEQVTIIPGNVECELVFTDSDSCVVGTANFMIIVEEAPYDPDAPSESVVPGITDLVNTAVSDAIGDDARDETREWLDEHPEATTTVQDGAVTWDKLNTDVQDKINAGTVKLDEFPGSTAEEKIKYVLENYTDAVVELGDIEINNTIQIEVSKDVRHVKFIDGKVTLNTNGIACMTFMPQFSNVDFVGSSHHFVFASGTVGAAFYNCNFQKCGIIDKGTSGSGYLQSLYIVGCDFRGMLGTVVRTPRAIDFKVDSTRFEEGTNAVIDIEGGPHPALAHGSITNSLFEGYVHGEPPIKIGTATDLNICNSYFEANHNGSIVFTDRAVRGLISGNFFSDTSATEPYVKGVTGQYDSVTFIRNRWTGTQPLTNLEVAWENNISNVGVTPSTPFSSGVGTRYHSLNYVNKTFDSETHTLTITFKAYGEFYATLRHLTVYIRGQYRDTDTLRRGFIHANVYTYIDTNRRASVKCNVIDGYVENGETGTLTATLPSTAVAQSPVLITLTTTDFISVDEVQLVDTLSLGSFYTYY